MRVNEKIIAKEIRVISSSGEQLGILTPSEAFKIAQTEGLDLVEVAPSAKPSVCKIMDYGKFLFQQKKKTHDARKKQKVFHVKEVKLRPKTEKHDIEFKIKHIEKFLKLGDKAKVTVMFQGRELAYTNIGREILGKIADAVKEFGVIEQPPRLEGSNMTMIVSPKHN